MCNDEVGGSSSNAAHYRTRVGADTERCRTYQIVERHRWRFSNHCPPTRSTGEFDRDTLRCDVSENLTIGQGQKWQESLRIGRELTRSGGQSIPVSVDVRTKVGLAEDRCA